MPGCATQGETMEEIEANVCEAIEGCLPVEFDLRLADLERAVRRASILNG
jgi:predicted RNase H-like HicB family nuclease